MLEAVTQMQAPLSVPDIVSMTARLAQVLAEEADLLEQMKVKDIEPLQAEKLRLALALEKQRQLVNKHPELLRDISSREREELREVNEVFNVVLAENHRRLLMARQVNQKIVQAITVVVAEGNGNKIYNALGNESMPTAASISITLNQTV